MIFLMTDEKPVLLVMLAESDVGEMRTGLTKFVDDRGLGSGRSFTSVVISLHKTNDDARAVLAKAGYKVDGPLATHDPTAAEVKCKACGGINDPGSLYEGRCIVCWATEAKRARLASG